MVLTIGPKRVPFNIHEALLQVKTSFFDVHPTPNGETATICAAEPEPDQLLKRDVSPATERETSEPSTSDWTSGVAGPVPNPPEIAESALGRQQAQFVPDYHLDIHFDAAFSVFVEWLYNTPPKDPRTPGQCKTLVQAYIIALRYEAESLQDLLIECIRRFHIEHQVKFDIFIYLLNRHGDDVNCKLIQYFVDQIAYEIAHGGIEGFDENNLGFDNFLKDRPGGGLVRAALVHALANIATKGKNGGKIIDPAVVRNHGYHVGRGL